MRNFFRNLPRWFQSVAIMAVCVIIFKALSSLGWVLILAAAVLWLLCLAGYFHRSGRLGTVGGTGVLNSFLGSLTAPAKASSSAIPNVRPSPPPRHQAPSSTTMNHPAKAPVPPSQPINAEEAARQLKSIIFGQDRVCDSLVQALRVGLAQKSRNKPLGVFLFAGPPGTGKTYLAKQMATALNRDLLHLDMSQFSDPQAATSLFGASKGFAGSDSYGALTGALKGNPSLLVLLDEFEKASPTVHKKFLTAFSEGFISESSTAEQILTRKAIFVLTTNAAHEKLVELLKVYEKQPDSLNKPVQNTLRECDFAPELLDRFDQIMVFSPLGGLDLARVAALEIEMYVRTFDMDIAPQGIDPLLLFKLVEKQKKESHSSVRELIRSIQKVCGPDLATLKEAGAKKIKFKQYDERVEVLRA